jgi:hypothetical protein
MSGMLPAWDELCTFCQIVNVVSVTELSLARATYGVDSPKAKTVWADVLDVA